MKNHKTCKLVPNLHSLLKVFIPILMLFFTFTGVIAQNNHFNIKFSNQKLSEVFKVIEDNSSYVFFYNDKDVDMNRNINLTFVNKTIEQVLSELFKNSSNEYKIDGRQIYITKRPPPNNVQIQTAQKIIKISGIITDDRNESVIGASIYVVGTNVGTAADLNGKFSLDVAENAQLRISHIGYEQQTVMIEGKTTLKISLVPALQTLEELIVVGYGTMKKRDITGAITSIDAATIEKRQPIDIYDVLQGEAPGVLVISNSGAPDDESTIRVRGTSTFEGGVNPLYVVDGVQMDNVKSINPNDIKSIEILKDAASSAIYGSRSANGVILISTKKGEPGKLKVNARYLHSFSNMSYKIPQSNANERNLFQAIRHQRQLLYNPFSLDPNAYNTSGNTDYQDLMTRVGNRDQYDISISSATESTKFYNALSYLSEKGIIYGSYNKRFTFRSTLDYQANKKLLFTTTVNYSYQNANKINEGIVIGNALKRPPHFVLFFPDGSPMYDNAGMKNPYADATMRINDHKRHTASLNEIAKYEFNKYLKVQISISGNLSINRNQFFASGLLSSTATEPGKAVGGDYTDFNRNLSGDAFLSYKRSLGKHNISSMIGTSAQDWYSENLDFKGSQYVSESVLTVNSIQVLDPIGTTTGATSNSMASFFGRGEYNYAGKYLLNFTLRADGSSRFISNRWGYFPSVSTGWRFSDEKFMIFTKKALSDAKIRLSWGVTGNESIGDYDSKTLFTFGSYYYNDISGVQSGSNGSIGNPNIKWEETSQTNLGLDLSFFNGRLKSTIDFYDKHTDGLLYKSNMPSELGYNYMRINFGAIQNRGIEIDVNAVIVKNKDFSWETVLNFSTNSNKILSLGGSDYVTEGNWLVAVGQPMGQFYGIKSDGVYAYDESNAYTPDFKTRLTPVFQRDQNNNIMLSEDMKPTLLGYKNPDGSNFVGTPSKLSFGTAGEMIGGDVILKDLDGNGIIDDKDRVVLGNGYAKWFGSWTNTINYKQFSLNFNFYGSFGNLIYNQALANISSLGNFNLTPPPYGVVNAWAHPGQITNVPLVFGDKGRFPRNQQLDVYLEDGSFLRLRNARVAYSFDKSLLGKLNISTLSMYVYGNNLLTWTNYTGFDPELGGAVLTPGFDSGRFPKKREFGAGVNLVF